MTANAQKSTFNIFQILSAGDKELVHSSMIKFLIEESSSFRKEFLGAEFEQNKDLYIKLEHSDKIAEENKRLRFDLLIYDNPEDRQLLFAIENKFKATPAVHQLKDYDKYFIKHKDFKKYLIVFSEEQIPSDVRKYCDAPSTKWEIRSYFDFHNPNSDVISVSKILEKINKTKIDNSLLMTLLHQYGDYLGSINTILKPCFENIYLLKSAHFEGMVNDKQKYNVFRVRDLHFRYLLYIQGLISSEIGSGYEYSTGNDGGSRPIPSVPLWGKNNMFFTIDGDSMKIGFWYNHNKSKIATEVKDEIIMQLEKSEIWVKKLNGKINNPNLKNNGNSSVVSLVSYNLKNWPDKSNFVKDASTIFKEYYKLYDQCKNVEKLP